MGIGKYIATIGAMAAAGLIVNSAFRGIGEEVYRGRLLDHQEVVYEEDRFKGDEGFFRNVMTVVDEDKTYALIDYFGETSIDWRNDTEPNFGEDELEKIVISGDGEEETFYSEGFMANWNPTTVDGRWKKTLFEDGNLMYNDLRSRIRNLHRSRIESLPSPFDQQ